MLVFAQRPQSHRRKMKEKKKKTSTRADRGRSGSGRQRARLFASTRHTKIAPRAASTLHFPQLQTNHTQSTRTHPSYISLSRARTTDRRTHPSKSRLAPPSFPPDINLPRLRAQRRRAPARAKRLGSEREP